MGLHFSQFSFGIFKGMSGQLENELEELINKKKEVDRNITQLESQIYNYETSFLEESKTNITRGLDGYLSNRSDRKHYNVKDTDRIFSNSSSTFQKVLFI